ncbi:extracellular solute-binding protein [Pseudoroseicyclus aestuarii]|uniref:Microcin C transport system substrate-binding protein n=1 Tax=Pseudoroseicyclus aestuarii TaxID=1795041 RepID=A0A318SQK2_9RHOB|nr:extracellular solute-binding protein [Pseudoroseicyclus aestuarii]PYE83962.1 microcin C transport system substrate-binding protein [Pseudoroseicyclus aestuarii]
MSSAARRACTLAPALAAIGVYALSSQPVPAQEADPAATQAEEGGGEDVTVSYGYTNFGELQYPEDFDHLAYVNPDAPKGGEMSQWSPGVFDSVNPYTTKGSAVGIQTGLMYESVLNGAADDNYSAYCYMCTTLEYPADRSWVVFNLRDDVRFWDGTPMTAGDIKFSFELFLEQGIPEFRTIRSSWIDSIEIEDPHRIRFNFTEAAPPRDIVTFAGGMPVFSKAWFEESGTRLDDTTFEPFMATGPYDIESLDAGRSITYGRVDDWWGAEDKFNIGQFNFDTIRIEYFADSTAAFEAFKAGEYTFRSENSERLWATGYEFPAVENGWVVTEALPNEGLASALGFTFNLDEPQWQDIRVREAVGLMFNFEWSNKSLFYGLNTRVNSFWQNSDLEAVGTPSEGEVALLQPLVEEGLLDESILTDEAVMAPVSSERALDRAALRRASALLDEAGWTAGPSGARSKDGVPLTLTILQYNPEYDRIVNPFIENLQRLGVAARLERVDTSQYVTRRDEGDFGLANQLFSLGLEPSTVLYQWFGSATAGASSRNLMRLRNPAVDRLIEPVIAAQTLDELRTSVHALDRVLRADRFWIPQWYNDEFWVAYYDMYRHPETLPEGALGSLSLWWYDEAAAQDLREAGALR